MSPLNRRIVAQQSRRLHIHALLTFLGALVLALGVSISQANADETIDFGIAVRGDEAPLLIQAEQTLGRRVDVVRSFAFWGDDFPTAADLAALDGRDLILSIKAQHRSQQGGERILWADIAAAQPGDPLYQDMVDWATALEPYEDQIWINFHHEPEACLLYTSPSPRDRTRSRMPSSA